MTIEVVSEVTSTVVGALAFDDGLLVAVAARVEGERYMSLVCTVVVATCSCGSDAIPAGLLSFVHETVGPSGGEVLLATVALRVSLHNSVGVRCSAMVVW